MSADVPLQTQRRLAPRELMVVTSLGTMLVVALLWLWAVFATPSEARGGAADRGRRRDRPARRRRPPPARADQDRQRPRRPAGARDRPHGGGHPARAGPPGARRRVRDRRDLPGRATRRWTVATAAQ